MVTSCETVIQCHNQNIDIDTIHQFYSDFLSAHICVYVCACVYVCIYLILCSFITCVSICRCEEVQAQQGWRALPLVTVIGRYRDCICPLCPRWSQACLMSQGLLLHLREEWACLGCLLMLVGGCEMPSLGHLTLLGKAMQVTQLLL